MIQLDLFDQWMNILDQHARRYLRPEEYQQYQIIPEPQWLRQVQALLEFPIARFTPVNEVFSARAGLV